MEDENTQKNLLDILYKYLVKSDKEWQTRIDAEYDKMSIDDLKVKVKELEGTVNDLKSRMDSIEYNFYKGLRGL
jgi:hypothetical protein